MSDPHQQAVRIWRESIAIPTYGVGQPNKNPMFLEKRVYQGSSGAVYPHAVIDKIHDEKSDQQYEAVFLENRWLKIMILPELGGRVQMALDKTNDYHFVYYNRVIKPALVGLAGPWVSGGIEFNWPQHHRPSTFEPMQWRIVDNDDGSKTLWCSEIERMFGTKGMHGFTIHPDKAYLEIKVQLYNRTATPQTFLWWANPAVAVNDDYQSVFPQDVHAVMDHGKRDASDFPIATGTYYKMDYSPGTDISRYKNIPVPTSFMAYHSDYNFLGCYDHGPQAGLLHVANHHIAQRDDLMIERITLANSLGQHDQALDMLMGHQFHPWEGGEGKVIGQYVFALVQLARQAIDDTQYPQAIDYLERAQVYPPNTGEGKLIGAKENQIHYYLGVAYELVGEIDQAKQCWAKASVGLDKPGAAMYYNDQPPDTIYYQGLALKKLGKPNEAKVRFDTLIEFGQSHLHDEPTIDYFAVSLPDFLVFDEDLTIRNQIHCLYMMGLGHLGLGQNDQAKTCLDQVLSLDVSHLGTGVGIANS